MTISWRTKKKIKAVQGQQESALLATEAAVDALRRELATAEGDQVVELSGRLSNLLRKQLGLQKRLGLAEDRPVPQVPQVPQTDAAEVEQELRKRGLWDIENSAPPSRTIAPRAAAAAPPTHEAPRPDAISTPLKPRSYCDPDPGNPFDVPAIPATGSLWDAIQGRGVAVQQASYSDAEGSRLLNPDGSPWESAQEKEAKARAAGELSDTSWRWGKR